MKRNQFEKMFYSMAEGFPYEFVEEAKKLAGEDKCFLQKLNQKCEAYSHRHNIDVHDSLHHYFSIGKILPTSYERKNAVAEVTEIAENNGWSVNYDKEDNTIEFGKYSPCGQDFSFYIGIGSTLEEIADKIYEYAEDFDVDYEASLWVGEDGHGKNGAPYHIKDLVEDMEACEKYIYELEEAVRSKIKVAQ